ncbi:hypothetical protein [Actinacidiphila acidipaludis]|nr:hypothetical protein [Streptomyces acidipaludis]
MSRNDVFIHPLNGHPTADGMVTEVDRELERLRREVQDLAVALRD